MKTKKKVSERVRAAAKRLKSLSTDELIVKLEKCNISYEFTRPKKK